MFGKIKAIAAIATMTIALTFGSQVKAQTPAAPVADPLSQIATFDFGKSRAPLMAVEDMSRQADQKAKVEEGMIKVIENPKATFAGKQFACRMLRLVGTEKSVPALASLLADAKLTHMARWALQAMPFPAVDEAFLKALDALQDNLVKSDVRVGIISSMGARKGGAKAVAKLAALAASDDKATAEAAIVALGKIGGDDAVKALTGLSVKDKALKGVASDAMMLAADGLLAEGKTAEAEAIYKPLYAESSPIMIRVAALRGLVRAGKEKALALEIDALKSKRTRLPEGAAKYFNEIPGAEATKALCDAMDALTPRVQVMALTTLQNRGDKSAAATAVKMLASKDEAVQVAAAKSLVALGGAAQVKALADLAVKGGAAGDAASEALTLIHGDGVAASIRELAGMPDAKIRERAILAIEARRDGEAVALLTKATGDSDRFVKTAAAKALGTFAGEKDIPALAGILVASKSESERGSLEKTLVSIANRVQNKDAAADAVVAKMNGADNAAKGHLMVVLAGLTGPKAYDAINAQLTSTDLELKKAAIRAFATWPEQKPAPQLLEIAKSDADAACKVIALRGYVDLVSKAADSSPADKVKQLKEAWELAKAADDKTMILKGAGNVPDKAALDMVDPMLADTELGVAAQFAYVSIAGTMKNKGQAAAALLKVQGIATNDAVKKAVADAMKKQKITPGATPKAGRKAQPGAQKNAGKKGNAKGARKGGKAKGQAPAQPPVAAAPAQQ